MRLPLIIFTLFLLANVAAAQTVPNIQVQGDVANLRVRIKAPPSDEFTVSLDGASTQTINGGTTYIGTGIDPTTPTVRLFIAGNMVYEEAVPTIDPLTLDGDLQEITAALEETATELNLNAAQKRRLYREARIRAIKRKLKDLRDRAAQLARQRQEIITEGQRLMQGAQN